MLPKKKCRENEKGQISIKKKNEKDRERKQVRKEKETSELIYV